MGPYPSFHGIKQPRVWHFLPLLPYPFPPSSSLHQDGISVLHRVTPRISGLRVPQPIEHNEGMYELTFSYKKLEVREPCTPYSIHVFGSQIFIEICTTTIQR